VIVKIPNPADSKIKADYRWARSRRHFRPLTHGPRVAVGRILLRQITKRTRRPVGTIIGFGRA
jgi:hypothetical protein